MHFSCNEIEPVIPKLGPPELGDRKVLIEEFTGVQCVNCPQGSAEIENFLNLYGEQLIAVSIHSGFFSDPYSDSQYDFRTDEGEALEGFLGEPVGYPSAVINRTIPSGRTRLQLGQASWASAIAESAQVAPQINLNLNHTYETTSRNISLIVGIIPLDHIANNTSLSVMLTETNIQDVQLTPNGKDANYFHKHVLRKMLSNVKGDPISQLNKGTLLEKTYDFTLSNEWLVENCRLIVFVSSDETKEVLQVEVISIEE